MAQLDHVLEKTYLVESSSGRGLFFYFQLVGVKVAEDLAGSSENKHPLVPILVGEDLPDLGALLANVSQTGFNILPLVKLRSWKERERKRKWAEGDNAG